jgi:hypothetical protein
MRGGDKVPTRQANQHRLALADDSGSFLAEARPIPPTFLLTEYEHQEDHLRTHRRGDRWCGGESRAKRSLDGPITGVGTYDRWSSDRADRARSVRETVSVESSRRYES